MANPTMCHVRKVWMGLLLVLTAVVSAGVVYVIVHNDPVSGAGDTPGYSASPPPSLGPVTTPSANAESSSGRAVSASPRTVFLGDDYTLGAGATSASKSWTTLVADSLGLAPVIVGESGAGYAKQSSHGRTYASFVSTVVAAKPNLVVVSGGRNDVFDDPSTFSNAVKSLFAELRDRLPDATIIAIAPWWGDSKHPANLAPIDAGVRSGVRASGGVYLDPGDPLEGHPRWMADDAHPNNKGYRAIAEADGPAIAGHLP